MTAIWLLNKTTSPAIIKRSLFPIGDPGNAAAYGVDWPTLVANMVPEVSSNLVAGVDQEVQFNEGGVFGANAALKYDYLNNILTVDAGEVVANLFNGIALTTAGAGNLWLDDSGAYSAPVAAPAGLNFNVQFNDGGVLAGDSNFNWNKATAQLTVSGSVVANLFNGVALTAAGVATNFLNATGNYSTPPLTPPAGSVNELQFNNGGVFGSDANLTWDGATLAALAFNGVALTNGGIATDFLNAAGNYVSPVAGLNTELQFNNGGVFGSDANLTWDGASLGALAFNGVALSIAAGASNFLDGSGVYRGLVFGDMPIVHGEWLMAVTNGTATVIASPNTPVKVLTGGNDVGNALNGVTKPVDNRLSVTLTETSTIQIAVNVSASKIVSGSTKYRYHVYMDGAPLTNALFVDIDQPSSVADPSRSVSLEGSAENVPAGAHFFELWAENLVNSDDILITTGSMSIGRIY